MHMPLSGHPSIHPLTLARLLHHRMSLSHYTDPLASLQDVKTSKKGWMDGTGSSGRDNRNAYLRGGEKRAGVQRGGSKGGGQGEGAFPGSVVGVRLSVRGEACVLPEGGGSGIVIPSRGAYYYCSICVCIVNNRTHTHTLVGGVRPYIASYWYGLSEPFHWLIYTSR